MMDWRTELEMDGDVFNNYLKNYLDIYRPPFISNTAIRLTKPETNILNTFTQDYESSPSAGDGLTGKRMTCLPFNIQGLSTTHIPPYGVCAPPLQLPIASQVLAKTICNMYSHKQ